MKGWGITLIIIGIGSFILPLMDIQFRLISIFGKGNEVAAGIVYCAAGGLLFLIGSRKSE